MQSRLNQIVDESSSVGKALTEWYAQHNIQIYDQQGQLMSLYDILSQVAKIWSTLTTNEKDYYLNQQAGANQTTQLSAILSNFKNVLKATTTAQESLGSAARENAAYMESLEAKTNSLKAEFQDLATNVLDKELIGGFLDMGSGLLKLADALPPIVVQVGLLAGVLAPLGALLSKFYLGPVLGISANLVPIGAALAIAVPLVLKLFSAWKDANPTFEEATNQIQSLNDALSKNQTRLEEINKIPWYERTTEINQEKAALERENDELRDQIKYYKQLRAEKAQKTAEAPRSVYQGVKEYRVTTKVQERGEYGAYRSFSNLEKAQDYARDLGDKFGTLTTVLDTVVLKGDELDKNLIENLTHINDAMVANGEVSEDLSNWWQHNGDVVKEQYQAYKDLEAVGKKLTQEQQALIEQYELFVNIGAEATEQTKFLAENVIVSQDAVSKLTKQYPELSSAISENNGQLGINISKLDGVQYSSLEAKQAVYDLAVQMVKANANQLDMSTSIAQLQQLALSAGVANSALNFTDWVDEYGGDQVAAWEAYTRYFTNKIKSALKETWVPVQKTNTNLGNLASSTKELAKETEKASDATNELNKWLKEEEDRLKGVVSALEDKISAYETLFGYLQDQIDVEIDALEAQKQALQEQNDELETQVELEEKLDALARAKSQKAMVYKNGRFQYVSDIDETSKAQTDLEKYYRNQEYQAQLDAIDAQIEALENQKKQIDLGQEQIKQQQDLAKVVKQLGIDFTNGWRDVFDDLDVYLSGYKTSLADLEKYTDNIETLQQESIDYSKLWLEAYESGASQQVLDAIHQLEVERRKEAGDTSVYNPTTGTWSSSESGSISLKPASSETDSKGRPVSGVGSNQYNYLSNLASTGTAGQKAWAEDQLAKGKYATGTTSARGGLSLVGEKGAELRVLNQGDGILPADITKNLWAWGSLTPTTLVNALGGLGSSKMMSVSIANLNLPEVRDGEGFVNYMKNNFWRSAVQTNFNR